MSEIKELKKLNENLQKAIGQVGAEYSYAKELEADLKKIETDEANEAIKDVKKGIKLINYLGRTNRYAERYENRLIKNLKELSEILPENQKKEALELANKIDIAEKKITKVASRYVGELRSELKDIATHEHLVKRFANDEKKLENVKTKLSALIKEVESEVAELIKWIQGAQAILKQIKGFDEKLHQMAA